VLDSPSALAILKDIGGLSDWAKIGSGIRRIAISGPFTLNNLTKAIVEGEDINVILTEGVKCFLVHSILSFLSNSQKKKKKKKN